MKVKKMLAVFMSVLSLAACILPFSGCGKTVGKVHNKGVKSGAVRDLTEGISKNESASKAPDDEFKAAASSFAAELFKDNYSKGKTTLVSPLSVLTALALVQNGAQGNTLAQLEQALGGLDRDTLNAYMRAYCDFLTESDELKIANSVWTDSSVEAKQAFLQKAVDSYSAQIFSAPLSSKKTVSSINSWVKKNTDGMIPKIIENADRDAVMMLINAVAFEAKWETPYTNDDIEKLEFNSYSGKSKKTEFMCSTESVYLSDSDAVGFMKPYKNGRFAFAALLPDENTGIDDYVASLSGDKLMKIFSSAKRGNEVNVKMPKFRAEYSAQLIDTLKKMGVKDAFDSKTADFSSLIENRDAYIATVVHKTFIEVDENGTRAAASTLVGADTMSLMEPYSVFLNRPFVYMIVDTETNLPLFIGVQTEI
ncbi:MAG: serpin family protein [Acutalibacteraceae bacterium]|nr:serpin family protein [Acutalibacteraceae bacterium]